MHEFTANGNQEFGNLPLYLLKGDNAFKKALQAEFVLSTSELAQIYYQMLLDCL